MSSKKPQSKPYAFRFTEEELVLIELLMKHHNISRKQALSKLIGYGSPYALEELYDTQKGVDDE